ATIDPTKGESTTITVEVPITADFRLFVKNAAGTEMRTLLQETGGAAGPRTATWDAKDGAGAVVPDGTYTITIEGLNASAAIMPAGGTVAVSASPPPTYAFTITGIQPTTIDPTKGESATITYDVPITAGYRLSVKDNAGTTIRVLQEATTAAAGTYTAAWDARDAAGAVVPDGTYTVLLEGLNASANITPASGTVSVSASPPPAYAFSITGIVPATIDPTNGESTTITYAVPITADYRLYVKDNTGAEVRALLQVTAGAAGTYTAAWDAKNDAGAVVPDGVYTVVIEGLNASGTIMPATGDVTVAASPPPTYAFTITSITPATVDPATGESATIIYEVPITADYRLYIKDNAGTEVRTLRQETGAVAGAYTATWDAKDTAGAVVQDGTYTVTIEGQNASATITPASGTVSVSVSPPVPVTELGQIVEGAGSSNFDWLRIAGYKLGIAFQAPKDGTITQVTLQWKSGSGYGAGSEGVFSFELHTDGPGHFPSGTVIARADNVIPSMAMDGYVDGAFYFPISATLTAGQRYHLVITNTDPDPSLNWSSPNGLMTRVLPWDGTGNRAAVYINGQWHPFSSKWNPWNTTGSNFVNGQHVPTMLTWSDGTNTGDPYYTSRIAAGAYFYGNATAGEYIDWREASVTIHRIGISVRRFGIPAGDLIYHLEQVGVGELATGTIATPDTVETVQQWCYAELPTAVTLEQGQIYRLWFESPGSENNSNCYFTSPVYGELRPSAWLECGWGGTHCYYIYGSNSPTMGLTTADLSFSLQ
ncbi:MAG: FlgD immunoglobulin-like domain containing protein, partial [Armatimonadota bacterium]